ncbi:hypothetical protein DCAR_0622755 [Daucus carota subsp. sativus]|uniref:Agenet domain-containing protein n=1 Tax=Daucus carota subsp. sativus TaxID=79200 RepID=A0AAF0X8R9_DAUCS|nr:hypothetical protein DCAR_0622664 [Daucus carota subsp. sativus]WOH03358.1 hypothetical protein DCAR_0622755 [Daucus carota subsp. sativus]
MRECFKIGADVEVFVFGWFRARVTGYEPDYYTLYIRYYDRYDDNGEQLNGQVHVSQGRPIPPKETVRNFEIDSYVDAFLDGGWWEGTVDEVHEGDRYTISFSDSTMKPSVYKASEVRLHRDWKLGKWVLGTDAKEIDDENQYLKCWFMYVVVVVLVLKKFRKLNA